MIWPSYYKLLQLEKYRATHDNKTVFNSTTNRKLHINTPSLGLELRNGYLSFYIIDGSNHDSIQVENYDIIKIGYYNESTNTWSNENYYICTSVTRIDDGLYPEYKIYLTKLPQTFEFDQNENYSNYYFVRYYDEYLFLKTLDPTIKIGSFITTVMNQEHKKSKLKIGPLYNTNSERLETIPSFYELKAEYIGNGNNITNTFTKDGLTILGYPNSSDNKILVYKIIWAGATTIAQINLNNPQEFVNAMQNRNTRLLIIKTILDPNVYEEIEDFNNITGSIPPSITPLLFVTALFITRDIFAPLMFIKKEPEQIRTPIESVDVLPTSKRKLERRGEVTPTSSRQTSKNRRLLRSDYKSISYH